MDGDKNRAAGGTEKSNGRLDRLQTVPLILPCATRQEWEQTLASTEPEARELLIELARFVDLWRYFEEHEEKLGRNVVRDIGGLHKLAPGERIIRLRKINSRLMRRVGNAGESPQFRQ